MNHSTNSKGQPKDGSRVYHHDDAENLPPHSHHDKETLSEVNVQSYWRANVKVLTVLLSLWALVSFGCGVLFSDWLDQFNLGGFPLGFWFTQQGTMLCFVAIIFIYHIWMKKIERAHGVDDDEGSIDNHPTNQTGTGAQP
jgi:putative solute:sodium symporter small subunit